MPQSEVESLYVSPATPEYLIRRRVLIALSDLRRTSMLYAIDVTDPYCPIPLDTMASEQLEYYQDPDTGNIMADKV